MSNGLFFTVMEAEGDLLQPFDDGGGDAPAEDVAPPATDNSGGGDDLDSPPPLNEDSDMDLSGDMSSDSLDAGGDDMGGDDSTDSEEDEADKKDTKLSDKANNILNQQLYQKMVNRNNEIEEIFKNIPFSNFKFGEFSEVTLPNKEQIRIFPFWTINNVLMITVTCL